MYIPDFDTFYHLSEQLYKERPLETRYSLKYRHCDGTMVLKVTDDVKCLKFKTDQLSDMKRIERITNMFCAVMAGNEFREASSQGAEVGGTAAAEQQARKARRKG